MIRVHPPVRMAGIKLQMEPEPPRGPPSLPGSVLAPDMAVQLPSDWAPRKAAGPSRGCHHMLNSRLRPPADPFVWRWETRRARGTAPRSGHTDDVNLCALPELLAAPVAADTASTYGVAISGQWASSSHRSAARGVHLSHALCLPAPFQPGGGTTCSTEAPLRWAVSPDTQWALPAPRHPGLSLGTAFSKPSPFLPSSWLTHLSRPMLSLTELFPKRNLPIPATSWIIIRIKGVGMTHTNFENLRLCCDHTWTWWVFVLFFFSSLLDFTFPE